MPDVAASLGLLQDASARLANVTTRRMFGCDGLFAAGNIFAIVWTDGRIGVRLPEPGPFTELMGAKGASPWIPPGLAKGMAHWVMVPIAFHDEPAKLATWVKRAHALNAALPPKKSSVKKSAAPAAKKKAAGKKSAKR